MQYTSIFIAGFRATGKTTIGKLLAEELGWDFIDMDTRIEAKAGMTINQLTLGGEEWQQFRQIEHDVLRNLIAKEKVVVSMGGGTTVNDTMKEGSEMTFGQINQEMLKAQKKALIIILTASEEVIAERMRQHEIKREEIKRPILNQRRAQDTHTHLEDSDHDSAHRKDLIIEEIICDSLDVYRKRKPLYAQLTNHVIDTGKVSKRDAVKQIIQKL